MSIPVSVVPVLRVMRSQRHYFSLQQQQQQHSAALPSSKSCWEAKKGWKWEKEQGQMSGHGRERIAKHCEHFSKMMFCASNILLTAAWSDPSIMCEYISSPGPPPPPCHPIPPLHRHTRTHTHTPYTHIFYLLKTLTTPTPTPPSFFFFFFFFYRSKLSKLCLKVNEGWLAPSLSLSLSLSLSHSLALLLSPFLLWHLSFFFLTCYRFWARW